MTKREEKLIRKLVNKLLEDGWSCFGHVRKSPLRKYNNYKAECNYVGDETDLSQTRPFLSIEVTLTGWGKMEEMSFSVNDLFNDHEAMKIIFGENQDCEYAPPEYFEDMKSLTCMPTWQEKLKFIAEHYVN